MDVVRRQIQVRGIVQGVGFRPFVYRLAQRFHLHGHVRNTGVGVLMEVEGAPQPVAEFLAGVAREHPPLAQIGIDDFIAGRLRCPYWQTAQRRLTSVDVLQ